MKRGTIVLTPFPFTDLTGRKVRPALVVSRSDRSGADVMLAFITTHRGGALGNGHLVLGGSSSTLTTTGLKHASVVRLDKIVTLDTSVLLGELGEMPDDLLDDLNTCLRYSFGIDPEGEPTWR